MPSVRCTDGAVCWLTLRVLVAALLCACGAGSGEGLGGDDAPPTPADAPDAPRAPRQVRSLEDLGLVEAPQPGADGPLAPSVWTTRDITPRSHRLVYKLDGRERAFVRAGFARFLTEDAALTRVGARVAFVPSAKCDAVPECVYDPAVQASARALEPLALRIQLAEQILGA